MNQAGGGGGAGNYYAGAPYQKGYGIASWLGGLFRSVFPLFRSGAAAVGREAARAGSSVLADVAAGHNLKESMNKQVQELVTQLKRKAEDGMKGSGAIKRLKARRGSHSATRGRKRKTSSIQDLLS
ncbi:hypothetical protein ONE63_006682 [Megalurothrips usitatus]|uniref:Uncharacterized protein n=1 Tax=Megalurothrips usitatus TaxID=439358 RepID=A0AAV7XU49_9NEOP|nr:hypothetical protein ONE63_006682 [Megalurothrips usitatus]